MVRSLADRTFQFRFAARGSLDAADWPPVRAAAAFPAVLATARIEGRGSVPGEEDFARCAAWERWGVAQNWWWIN